jgi:hypothetical protein
MVDRTNPFTPKGVIEFEVMGPCPSCGWDGPAFNRRKLEAAAQPPADPVSPRPEPLPADGLTDAPEPIRVERQETLEPKTDKSGQIRLPW